MTPWQRLLLKIGLHEHEQTWTCTYAWGGVRHRCWCGHRFPEERDTP